MTEAIVRYFGGPLDGRQQGANEAELVPGATIRHVYLHGGPKVETLYELNYCAKAGWEYRLCTAVNEEEAQSIERLPLDPA